MGEAAAKFSDQLFITSDNPRSEVPFAILNDILPGVGDTKHELIVDRREAINRAIEIARPYDIILIAGKGHETYQEVNGVKTHFDDRVEARKAIIVYSKKKEAEFEERQRERDERDRNRPRDHDEIAPRESGEIRIYRRQDAADDRSE